MLPLVPGRQISSGAWYMVHPESGQVPKPEEVKKVLQTIQGTVGHRDGETVEPQALSFRASPGSTSPSLRPCGSHKQKRQREQSCLKRGRGPHTSHSDSVRSKKGTISKILPLASALQRLFPTCPSFRLCTPPWVERGAQHGPFSRKLSLSRLPQAGVETRKSWPSASPSCDKY